MLAYDIDLAVTADRFEFGKADMTDVQLAVLLKDGLLTQQVACVGEDFVGEMIVPSPSGQRGF